MLNLNRWLVELTGIPGHHAWWCYQFDAAVGHFGRYVDGKLEELDEKGRRKHSLESILGPIVEKKRKRKNPSLAEVKSALQPKGRGILVEKG